MFFDDTLHVLIEPLQLLVPLSLVAWVVLKILGEVVRASALCLALPASMH